MNIRLESENFIDNEFVLESFGSKSRALQSSNPEHEIYGRHVGKRVQIRSNIKYFLYVNMETCCYH